jgi:hypothetical protein
MDENPAKCNCSTTWLPINPVPPKTIAFMLFIPPLFTIDPFLTIIIEVLLL